MAKILQPLETDHDFDKHFNYRSIIGMLVYLEKGPRPDLAYAVNQCVRYSCAPKQGHAAAIKVISAYLMNTNGKGIIMKPQQDKEVEIYVDTDFAGAWTQVTSNNVRQSLSRTGYTLCYARCPVLCKSQLQTMIALSIAEAEYIAMSTALRTSIPVLRLVNEISENMPGISKIGTIVKCNSTKTLNQLFAWHTAPIAHTAPNISSPKSTTSANMCGLRRFRYCTCRQPNNLLTSSPSHSQQKLSLIYVIN